MKSLCEDGGWWKGCVREMYRSGEDVADDSFMAFSS